MPCSNSRSGGRSDSFGRAHPGSGLARDRTGTRTDVAGDLVATGGSGFGVMAIVVAVQRGWVTRADAVDRLHLILDALERAQRYHGVFPHFFNGATGATIRSARRRRGPGRDVLPDGGLLTVRAYFDRAASELKSGCARA